MERKVHFNLAKLGFMIILMAITQLQVMAQQIKGKVIEAASGQPLSGCSVVEKGSTNGVFTDQDGNYAINVANNEAVLIYSFIGFETIEMPFGTHRMIEVKLKASSENLNEIVVVAYGIQKKSDVTGAIGSVKSKDFNKGVIANPNQLLHGKVAGVNVTAASGEPGAAQNVIIRGVGSLRSGTTPLYVIDGFTLDNTSLGVATNPLNFINPEDIESIDVLKDASAAALYGARAANGVVVITTKKGKIGKSEMNFSASTAFSSLSKAIDVFSADEFRKQVSLAGGTLDDKGANTNWQDELTRTAVSKKVNLSKIRSK